MKTPMQTSLQGLLIASIFFGLTMVYQACGNKKKEMSDADLAEKVEDVADSYTEDSFFEDDNASSTSNEPVEEIDYSGTTYTEDSHSTGSTYTPVETRATSTTGTYMVVAGNYLLEDNADVMVRKLKSNGFQDAQKVVFDLSQYYTVIAGAYDARSSADDLSARLSGMAIDNYVLRRRR